jgi:arylsulfatase A-like enzyme
VNVIVICIDTLRWDHLGCYGDRIVRTPALDAFARDATRFDAAYCASFPTIPMRTDAFTGNVKWPVYGWKRLGDDEVTVVQCLKDAGYHTAFTHDTSNMVPTNFGRDFDEDLWLAPPEGWEANAHRVEFPVPREHLRQNGTLYQHDRARTMHFEQETDWFVARTMLAAAKWLEDNYRRDRFFLWVDTFEVHEDWYAPSYYTDLYSPRYDGPDYTYPSYGYTDIYGKRELARLRACYAAEVTLTDRWVGHLLRQIELTGLLERSLVVILSDHGTFLGEHRRMGKHTVVADDPWPIYDEVGRIPLLVRLPGRTRPKRLGALVQPADLMPTFLDVARAKGPETYGRSLLRLLLGRTKNHWDHVFSACHSGTREGRIPYLSSCITVTSPRWTYVTAPAPWKPALHDRRTDPGQTRNLIRRHPDIAARLAAALRAFMREQGAEEAYVEEFARG